MSPGLFAWRHGQLWKESAVAATKELNSTCPHPLPGSLVPLFYCISKWNSAPNLVAPTYRWYLPRELFSFIDCLMFFFLSSESFWFDQRNLMLRLNKAWPNGSERWLRLFVRKLYIMIWSTRIVWIRWQRQLMNCNVINETSTCIWRTVTAYAG